MNSHASYTRKILSEVEVRQQVTQRDLANKLGIALGLTNLLVRRLVKKGWIKVVNVKPNRVRYLLTPEGIAAKARATRHYLEETITLYTETRERIRARLEMLSKEWPASNGNSDDHNGQAIEKNIVFYGAGDEAEIGYISLQAMDLRLVGVVDDRSTKPFFGIPVYSPSCLTPDSLNGQPFGRLVIMSLKKAARIRTRLEKLGFPQDRVFWL